MVEKEYKEHILRIQELISEHNYLSAKKELEILYALKPIRMELYILKSQLLELDKNAIQILSDKVVMSKDLLLKEKFFEVKVREALKRNDQLEARRVNTIGALFGVDPVEDDIDYCSRREKIYERLQRVCQECWENGINYEQGRTLAGFFYELNELIAYVIVGNYCKFLNPDGGFYFYQWPRKIVNVSYLVEKIQEKSTATFVIVINSDKDAWICRMFARLLSDMSMKVFLIDLPLIYQSEDTYNFAGLLSITIDNVKVEHNIHIYTPICWMQNRNMIYDNTNDLLNYLINIEDIDYGAVLIASGKEIEQLALEDVRKGFVERLTHCDIYSMDENIALGRVGRYMDYLSDIYMMKCSELVDLTSSCRFSIVIPARNSSATLRYTLQTCLEQTYNGSYEIIVSDNSTGNNASVYNLCKELNDSRIVYLKTPRDLHLPKSFEYAYLHAKGEYIFAVGSDDGVLPWALEALDKVVTQYPEEEIIQWERGFYAWPGFNGGQQHQFIIPGKYGKDDFGLFYREKLEYLASVFKDSANMYILPMLYINSCFKRSYFQTLLDKTGRLWDGICQDIYMGVVTACINPRILNMRYPLTIAGMSSGSVGANANLGTKTNEEFDKLMKEVAKDNNIGGFCPSYFERFLPQTGTDASSLYGSLLRAISFGILPEEYLEAFDWKRIFLQLAAELDIRDVVYDRKIHQMQYAASLHGEEFLSWFNEAIYEPGLTPRVIDEEKIKANAAKRKYSVGEAENGSLTLDASEYGVQNVYDAVQLFKRLMPL